MGYEEFYCNHVYAGVVSVIQFMVVFTLLLDVMDSVPPPADAILMWILDVIIDHNLALLIGKWHHM